jgi:hypothetical protein
MIHHETQALTHINSTADSGDRVQITDSIPVNAVIISDSNLNLFLHMTVTPTKEC